MIRNGSRQRPDHSIVQRRSRARLEFVPGSRFFCRPATCCHFSFTPSSGARCSASRRPPSLNEIGFKIVGRSDLRTLAQRAVPAQFGSAFCMQSVTGFAFHGSGSSASRASASDLRCGATCVVIADSLPQAVSACRRRHQRTASTAPDAPAVRSQQTPRRHQ